MKFLIMFLAAVLSTPLLGQQGYYQAQDPSRSVAIIGTIDGTIIPLAQQIEAMSRHSKAPIYLLINSPGGSLTTGMLFVDAMRQAQRRGVRFHCASSVMAASMAFIILSYCDRRYVTANTRLLFHPVSIRGASARVQELVVGLDHLIEEEQTIMRRLQRQLGMTWKQFHRNYFAETFWTGRQLAGVTKKKKFLTVVTRIEGFGDDVFKYQRPKKFSLFGNEKNDSANPIVERVIRRFENLQHD